MAKVISLRTGQSYKLNNIKCDFCKVDKGTMIASKTGKIICETCISELKIMMKGDN